MATVTKPIALDESFNTTEVTPRNIADVLAEGLSHITGRTASEVEYDNTASGLTADNVQGAIDELKSDIPTVNDGTLTIQQNGETKGTFTANQSGNSTVNIETPTTDIQTAVDEFSTYNGGILDSLKVALSPIQDLSHGDPSPTNICPISGHTQADVDVSDGQTTQEQITVNLGGTYYSGLLDVVSGKFVNDGEKPNLPTNFNYSSSAQYFYRYIGNVMGDILACDIFKPSTAQNVVNHTEPNIIAFQQSTGNLIVYAPDFTDASSFNSAIAGYTYARKKLTPTSIQLSPTMVKALVGENHLSAPLEGQEITESKYKQTFTFDDVIAYIQSLS